MKKSRKRKKSSRKQPRFGGFDFGFLPRIMLASTSSFDMNQAFLDAKVTGCGYGLDSVEGFPEPIPCLTIIGQDEEPLASAFSCFHGWGADKDGDVVDISIVFKKDGGYLLAVQPNYERMIYRMLRDAALVQPLLTGLTWIKSIDSTNPILFDWREYAKSSFSPFLVTAAVAQVRNGAPQTDTIQRIRHPNSFIKLEISFSAEEDEPSNWLISMTQGREIPGAQIGPPKICAKQVAIARNRVIDAAFPATRDRVKRWGKSAELQKVHGVTEAQVLQAIINLILSHEWTGGYYHFKGVKNLEQEWWRLVRERIELCGPGYLLETINKQDLTEQISLDVEYTLSKHGANLAPRFSSNQKLFLRLGYGGAI